jgi:hypothetical protein
MIWVLEFSESAYKPGSVLLRGIIIRLGLKLLLGSSNLPGSRVGHAFLIKSRNPIWSCSGWSLPCNQLLPVVRCALTAPFHPYQPKLAVFSLLHLSWAYAPQPLTGTLPCGARTFLPLIIFVTGSDYPANSPRIIR